MKSIESADLTTYFRIVREQPQLVVFVHWNNAFDIFFLNQLKNQTKNFNGISFRRWISKTQRKI